MNPDEIVEAVGGDDYAIGEDGTIYVLSGGEVIAEINDA